MLNWIHSWMSVLPLWLQFIVGIASFIVTALILTVGFPKLTEYIKRKFREL